MKRETLQELGYSPATGIIETLLVRYSRACELANNENNGETADPFYTGYCYGIEHALHDLTGYTVAGTAGALTLGRVTYLLSHCEDGTVWLKAL